MKFRDNSRVALLPKSTAVNPYKHWIRLRRCQVVCVNVDVHRVQVAIKLSVRRLEREVDLREPWTFFGAIEGFVPRLWWFRILVIFSVKTVKEYLKFDSMTHSESKSF